MPSAPSLLWWPPILATPHTHWSLSRVCSCVYHWWGNLHLFTFFLNRWLFYLINLYWNCLLYHCALPLFFFPFLCSSSYFCISLIISSLGPILPLVLALLIAILVLLLASSSFLSSFALIFVSSTSFCFCYQIFLHEDWIFFHSTTLFSHYYLNNFLFPWYCIELLHSTIVASLATMLGLTHFLWII